MKLCNSHTTFWIWANIFLHKIAEIVSVAPSIPGMHPSFRSSREDVSERSVDFLLSCPISCDCSLRFQKVTVDCNGKKFQDVPKIPLSTFELLLSDNQLTTLSYNSTLINLELLNVSNNLVSMLNKDWLSTLNSLKTLDLSKNKLKTGDLENAFGEIFVEYIYLSSNYLDKISRTIFFGMKALKELDLSNNQIQQIDNDSFSSLVSLVKLDLSLNKLIEIRYEWFINLKKLNFLCLQNNNLQLLSNLIFSPLNSLQYLDLAGNEIGSVGLLTFKGLTNLTNLNISSNKIGMLQEGVFRSFGQLKIMDLSNNPLRSFDRSFIHTSNLEVLFLRGLRNFTTITKSSLLGLINVEVIDFSGSKSLSDINQHAFSVTKQLKSLDISSSNLRSLKNGVFHGLKKVESIKLTGNPWICDCYIHWILLWLGENTNTHLLSPSETFCDAPAELKGHVFLDALDHETVCTNVSILKYTKKAQFLLGSTALLHCRADGSPSPNITWVTPWKSAFHWNGEKNGSFISKHVPGSEKNHEELYFHDSLANGQHQERFLLMKNGDLLIRDVDRGDGGFYFCIASNPLGKRTISIRLTLDYEYLTHIKIVSILVGLATSFVFLLLTLLSVLIKMILKGLGVKWPCQSGKSSPKSQQIRKILESMEHYKKQQLERLRENYNFQVQRIKDNCMQQMERLRESYSSQAERLRDIRDYGTLQIDRIRENYYFQVQRVRDYSTSQIERLRENYIFQRNRIRKFSAHHLYKLRENYKLQQQHLNKILENLNIESCRNVCQRTDSIVFEPDITLESVFVPKICLSQSFTQNNCDSVDNSSQISAYFTPDEAGSELSEDENNVQEVKELIVSDITKKCVSCTNLECKLESKKSTDSSTNSSDLNAIFCNLELHAEANETIV